MAIAIGALGWVIAAGLSWKNLCLGANPSNLEAEGL
jgi:hypothetical protein